MTRSGWRAFFAPIRWIILAGLIYFPSAGTMAIPRAWSYFIIFALGSLFLNVILLVKTPDLLNDRGTIKPGTMARDKFYVFTYFVLSLIVVPLVAGLEYRWLGHGLDFSFLYLAILLYVIALIFSVWPMLHNRFFEGTIRLQEDKNHQVIDTGPYAYVRHPGYIGMFLGSFTLTLAFGSAYALIPAILQAIIVIIRTNYEDDFLLKELEGYAEYAERVRYRLLPYIW